MKLGKMTARRIGPGAVVRYTGPGILGEDGLVPRGQRFRVLARPEEGILYVCRADELRFAGKYTWGLHERDVERVPRAVRR